MVGYSSHRGVVWGVHNYRHFTVNRHTFATNCFPFTIKHDQVTAISYLQTALS